MGTEQSMTALDGAARSGAARGRAYSVARAEYVCWTRMQAEAGQPLEAILERKERERRVGQGMFLWGVGNAPAVIANVLARALVPVRAVFSIMKSRPKAIDAAPSRTVAWRGYIDARGVEQQLPPPALVTSRRDGASGAKKVHYALMCRSEAPLVLRHDKGFDPDAFRNAGGNRGPVGASQVTALLHRVRADHGCGAYEANLTAWLTDSYWVRLTDPVELSPAIQKLLAESTGLDDADWLDVVAKVRSGPPSWAQHGQRLGTLI
jgi:hypothetical protein